MDSTHIVVLGAGVTGLTTALLLKQKGYQHITTVAKYVPGDMHVEYASPYAGAHWRTMAMNDNKLLQKFDTITYNKLMRMIKDHKLGQQTGVMVVPSFDYYDDDSVPEVNNPWFRDLVYNFSMHRKNLPPGAKVCHQYNTLLINSPVYLEWLKEQFIKLGGKIIQQSIYHIEELYQYIPKNAEKAVILNCAGLGAKYLGGVLDKKLFPTRGQTIVVNAPFIKKTMSHVGREGITYVIPRSDGTVILGGTINKDDFNPYVNDATIQSIIKRTTTLCPELLSQGPLKIVRHAVGLRPTRHGGPRFENEFCKSKTHDIPIQITHAYGHGGFGYQSSWGSAEHTIQVMEKGLFNRSRL